MDFEQALSGYKSKACILSVEKYPGGGYGNIRIAAGNKAHYDEMANVMHRPFIPDSPYGEYLPENKNFEDFCYRCAFLGQPLHTYVPLPQMGLWLNMFLLPLASDREEIGYCIYSYDVTPEADSAQRADVSAETSAAVLKTCIKLRSSENIRETFREVIEDIRQICDSDHCCILLTDSEQRSCMNLCEAIRPGCGLTPVDEYFGEDFFDLTQTWDSTIGDSTCIIIKDERDLEWLKTDNPIWYQSLCNAGVRSIVLFPLKHNGVMLGYLWAVNFNVEDTVKIKETLELTTFFLSAEISNFLLLQRLEFLSSMDMLTGVRNRNKMNAMMDDIISGKMTMQPPYAVIYADLNSFKHVNDEKGHSAGDRILKKAAEILCEAFPDCEVYRAGGDEFMIIAKEMDEDAVKAKQKQIKEQAASVEGLVFAIGSHIVHDTEDIRTAMRAADQEMYAEKREYYAKHPDQKSR